MNRERVFTSADPYELLVKTIAPLETPRPGYRILSIGEGPSNFVAQLLQNGYEAAAVDLDYSTAPRALIAETRDLLRNHDYYQPNSEVTQVTRTYYDATQNFRGNYIAALGQELPFKSGSIDRVVSFAAMGLHFEMDEFADCMLEAVRVTKPGGLIEIVPYLLQKDDSLEEVWKFESQTEFVPIIASQKGVKRVSLSRVDWRLNKPCLKLTVEV